ncbi:MAG: radical SAM protein [Desulfobacteraceae bacterium]|nr:MAG: radical SAM protein [Desulfobacteraceae bacterium]
MRVLLISPNIENLPDPVFPIGLACIAGALKARGIEYRVLDLCFAEDFEAAIRGALEEFAPEVVGLSLRNLDNVSYPNYVPYLPFYRQVVEVIRKNSQAKIVLGGSGFSLLPEQILDHLGADCGIVGEGEQALPRLLREMEAGRDIKQGVLPGGFIEDLDGLPPADRTGFDLKKYHEAGGMANLQTKRGCPFGCVYCTYPVIEGSRIRMRDPKRVCDEIEGLLQEGITHVFFTDNEFNFPEDHAERICREMIARKLAVKWSCYANPAFVDRRRVALMREAGCTGLEFGSDAAQAGMLANLGKNFSVADLQRASEACRESGMPFCHSLLLAGPGETMASVQETLETILGFQATAVICMAGIRIFPGTRLAAIAEQEGLVDTQTDFLTPQFYLAPAVKDDIVPLLTEFAQKHPNWIFPGLNIRMNKSLQEKLRRFGIKGPLWEHMKKRG